MPSPDFSKRITEELAKRASHVCSNPDCRIVTIGPSSDPEKSTNLGEAAHVYGARPNSARYIDAMSDINRSSITNGLWLCRNCHKRIDRDEKLYPADLLFRWREEHENRNFKNLGTKLDRVKYEQSLNQLELFDGYPPIIRRIVIDRPDGWEWSVTAELMRFLNRAPLRALDDLRSGLYVKEFDYVCDENALDWISEVLSTLRELSSPVSNLLERLTISWGAPGKEGDLEEIHHLCLLVRDYLYQIVAYEERIRFTVLSEDYSRLYSMLKDCVGSQAQKLEIIPDRLDEVLQIALSGNHGGTEDNPTVLTTIIEFGLPINWESDFDRELRKLGSRIPLKSAAEGYSLIEITIGFVIVISLIIVFF